MAQTLETQPKFPPQIKYIVGNEACERFSYYGMRAILVVFMTGHLMMGEAKSKEVYHLFAAACYLTPLAGAWISDRLWGKYNTILYLSLLYCLGHAALAIWENQFGLYLGLGLIALGSGGIKPCVSAHVGDQFNEKTKSLLNKVYDVFYFSINFGAFFSSLLTPLVLVKYGASWAFGIPGILMGIATLLFWMGRHQYTIVPPAGKGGEAGFMSVLSYALRNLGKRDQRNSTLSNSSNTGQEWLDVARAKFSASEVEGTKAALSIFKVFITVSVFWALFDQNGSSWVLQAEKMDLMVLGYKLEASQLQAANPIMVMVLIPFFTFFVYPMVEKLGIKVTPLRKMSVGMLLAALSFVCVGVFQVALDRGHTVNVAWQLLPYLIITCSEVMVSITGLEFAYTQAPRAMKSTIMSFWLLTVFVGNMLDAYVARINVFTGAGEFFFFAGLMFVVAVIFSITASRYKVRNFIEKAEGAASPALSPSSA
jgi:POT family proton-dependent oligopeptide transporter